MPIRRHSFLVLLMLLMSPLSWSEEEPYYMWTDENGVLNFSQREPKDKDIVAEKIEREHHFGSPMPKREEAALEEAAPAPVIQQNDDIPSEVTELERLNARITQQNCASARRTLEKLQNFQAIIVRGDDGFWREIPDDARQVEVTKAEEAIAEFCVEGP